MKFDKMNDYVIILLNILDGFRNVYVGGFNLEV